MRDKPGMRRRLVNLLTALSLLLCVAAMGLWTWNQWRTGQASIVGAWQEVHVVARPGGVCICLAELRSPQQPTGWAFGNYSVRQEDREWMSGGDRWSFLGFRSGRFFGVSTSGAAGTVRYVVLPHWSIAAIAALMPARFLWRQELRLSRRRKGRCAA